MIRRVPVETFFYITKVPEHEIVKPKILESISLIGINPGPKSEYNSHISNTDWHLPFDMERKYFEIVSPLFSNHFKEIKTNYGWWYHEILENYWFQQYEKGDWHGKHIHSNCLFSSVYYVELPEGSSKTTFRTPQQDFQIDINEGEIITFPAIFFHESKENKSEKRKTVIAANFNAKTWEENA
jgi:hypothetical protein